jgi:P27 family predicted phage terminase small subunit
LNADERKEYRRVGRQLVGLRVMTAADRDILALFAIAVARVARAEEQIRTSGEVVKSGAGQPIQNPWLTISQKWAMLAERFAQQLGLSPASRTRVQAAPTNDGGDDILDGPLRLAV